MLIERLSVGAMSVGVKALILVAPIRLRVVDMPLLDLLLVDHAGVSGSVDPGAKLIQLLVVVIRAHPRVQTAVPSMESADQVEALDPAIGQECAPMLAATVED